MKIYLVGGAVRDQLLGLPVKEKDWVVVGATVAEMLQQGFRQVGKDFPVFLHPQTNEEYALARTERKIGQGYTGFEFDAATSVTLEEDLLRRDLTINAIAQMQEGELIDPYHGVEDLKHKILRHVSPAFAEDPVRILRVGRFAARFAELGFHIADDTVALMKQMTQAGEVDALIAERVWKELERALQEQHPEQFFQTLALCDALPILFPSITMNGVGVKALQTAAALSFDSEVRFAALMHELPSEQVLTLCDRYRVPNTYRELALLAVQHYANYLRASKLTSQQLLDLLLSTDAFRRRARFQKFLETCEAAGKVQNSTDCSQATKLLLKVCEAASSIDTASALNANLSGKEIAEKINQLRLDAISRLITT